MSQLTLSCSLRFPLTLKLETLSISGLIYWWDIDLNANVFSTCVSVLGMPMETSYKNSVSLRQENLNQFNVSVLRIPLDKTVFH